MPKFYIFYFSYYLIFFIFDLLYLFILSIRFVELDKSSEKQFLFLGENNFESLKI